MHAAGQRIVFELQGVVHIHVVQHVVIIYVSAVHLCHIFYGIRDNGLAYIHAGGRF